MRADLTYRSTHAIRSRKERGAKIVVVDIYDNPTMKQADMRLIVNANGLRHEHVLASEGDWRAALRDHFGVVLG